MRLQSHAKGVGRVVHRSSPIFPANRPVNAFTRNARPSPRPIIDVRNSTGKSMFHCAAEVHRA